MTKQRKSFKNLTKTNAMRILDNLNIAYSYFSYTGVVSGIDVANILNQNPAKVFKTLVAQGKTGNYYVFMIPVSAQLNLKKAAKASSEKSIAMIPQKNLLSLTGYVHGGCSPIGMKKVFPTFIHKSATDFDSILFSGGKIGVQLELSFEDLLSAIELSPCDLID